MPSAAEFERDERGRIVRPWAEVAARPWIDRRALAHLGGPWARCQRCGARTPAGVAAPDLYDFELLHSLCDGQERLL